MNEYAFDVVLTAALRVSAANETEARAKLKGVFNCADCNGGAWPDGMPVLFEASINGEPELYEIITPED